MIWTTSRSCDALLPPHPHPRTKSYTPSPWQVSGGLARTQCGTPLYMSPEMCRGQAYTKAADTWAVGCVLLEVMSLQPPWVDQAAGRAAGLGGLLRQISSAKLRVDSAELRRHYSAELVTLLLSLLHKVPTFTPIPTLHNRPSPHPLPFTLTFTPALLLLHPAPARSPFTLTTARYPSPFTSTSYSHHTMKHVCADKKAATVY